MSELQGSASIVLSTEKRLERLEKGKNNEFELLFVAFSSFY